MTDTKAQNIFRYYFDSYGGIRALLSSKYFWFSFILTGTLYPYWSSQLWWEDTLSIMPNLLGFSLGGYAMLLAFGSEGFQRILAEEDDDESTTAFLDLNVAFVHFIVLQISSIILALLSKGYYFTLTRDSFLFDYANIFVVAAGPWYFLCYLVFIYAIVTTFAATFAILRVMRMYQKYLNSD